VRASRWRLETGGEFQSNWNTLTLDQLFDRIRNTMPLDRPQTLTAAETANTVSYILARTGFPAGTSPLPERSGDLKSVTYSTAKP
jgi:S-disulfanyl-L-cysteine oxidoreductase SoxD